MVAGSQDGDEEPVVIGHLPLLEKAFAIEKSSASLRRANFRLSSA